MRDRLNIDDYKHYFQKNNYLRVIRIARTPDLDDFKTVALISGVSVVLAGLLGFVIFQLMSFLPM